MFTSIKKAYQAYGGRPFLFVWSSFLYIMMFFLFLFASVAVFLIYFFAASLLGIPMSMESLEFIVPLAMVALFFIFCINGTNAALIRAYSWALQGKKTSLAEFHSYTLAKAPLMFTSMLVREVLSLIVIGPVVFAYFEYLTDYTYVEYLVGLYALFFLFIFHFAFTPAFISAGALGTDLFGSFRNTFRMLRKRHVYALGIFVLFAFAWVLNLIPVVNLCSIFIIYPVLLSALIIITKENAGA